MTDKDEVTPRLDGLYVRSHGDYSSFLMFTAAGRVSEVGSTGSAVEVARWLGPERSDLAQGTYVAEGEKLHFTTRSPSGQVAYDGRISLDAKELRLHVHSYINGSDREEVYTFVPVGELVRHGHLHGGDDNSWRAERSNSMEWDGLRKIYLAILSEEGFRPEIDSDGDIIFKYEGGTYAILQDDDDGYIQVLFPYFWQIDNSEERRKALEAASAATKSTKAAKVWVTSGGDNVSADFESLVSAPSEVRNIIGRGLRCIRVAVNAFREEMLKN